MLWDITSVNCSACNVPVPVVLEVVGWIGIARSVHRSSVSYHPAFPCNKTIMSF